MKNWNRVRLIPLMGVLLVALLLILLAAAPGLTAQEIEAEDNGPLTEVMRRQLADLQPPENRAPQSVTPCVAGMAGSYPCDNVDLMAYLPLGTFSASSANDIWGWTDPLDGKEYALMGVRNGTVFVDVTDPENPLYLGKLPTHTNDSTWRDIKVYANHAYVVSEASGHGMQVFDLTGLRNVANPPVTFSETNHYPGFGNAHNIVINEASGYAYAVGSSTCSGGLIMMDISAPPNVAAAGCFSADGYTHDAHCIDYAGPDPDYQGAEVCFNANEDTVTIVDVTDKANPVQLSRTPYTGASYTHQGWVTPDHAYYIQDDELDELNYGHNTRTRIWDVSDLDNPSVIDFYNGRTPSIDHNLYVVGDLVYQANYRSGLSILDASAVASGTLTETAYFDIYPANDSPNFNGAWSVYPYFESGTVIVSGIEQGLFVLRPNLGVALTVDKSQPAGAIRPGAAVTYTISVENTGILTVTGIVVTDTLNGVATTVPGPATLLPGETGTYLFGYTIQVSDCAAGLSNTASAVADGSGPFETAAPVVTEVNCMYLPQLEKE